jgi:hypothetical protein
MLYLLNYMQLNPGSIPKNCDLFKRGTICPTGFVTASDGNSIKYLDEEYACIVFPLGGDLYQLIAGRNTAYQEIRPVAGDLFLFSD